MSDSQKQDKNNSNNTKQRYLLYSQSKLTDLQKKQGLDLIIKIYSNFHPIYSALNVPKEDMKKYYYNYLYTNGSQLIGFMLIVDTENNDKVVGIGTMTDAFYLKDQKTRNIFQGPKQFQVKHQLDYECYDSLYDTEQKNRKMGDVAVLQVLAIDPDMQNLSLGQLIFSIGLLSLAKLGYKSALLIGYNIISQHLMEMYYPSKIVDVEIQNRLFFSEKVFKDIEYPIKVMEYDFVSGKSVQKATKFYQKYNADQIVRGEFFELQKQGQIQPKL